MSDLSCWVNDENDIAYTSEQHFAGEVNVAVKWRLWFKVAFIYYLIQTIFGCTMVFSIPFWAERVYDCCIF